MSLLPGKLVSAPTGNCETHLKYSLDIVDEPVCFLPTHRYSNYNR